MSAVFGVYHLDRRPNSERALTAISNKLANRGTPVIWHSDAVGLGLCVPAVRGAGPLAGDDALHVVAGDIRLDNRTALSATLGVDCRCSDADLVLSSYRRWGHDAPSHLVGDFAVAIWDASSRTLFCARDQMGVRPLYYYHLPDRLFVFSSDIKGVLACSAVPLRLNDQKVANYLVGDLQDVVGTFYRDVVRLPAGHSLSIGPGGITVRRYYSLDPKRELRLRSDVEYAEAFREHFIEAVRCRTSGGSRIGATLSGGLDSSSIVCAANRFLGTKQQPLCTFSLVFPGLKGTELQRIDERQHMEHVLASTRVRPDASFVRGDMTSPLCDWQQVYCHVGEPYLAPNLYLHWAMYKAAADKKVDVFLDGLDGDTTVSHGLHYLTELARSSRFIRFIQEGRALARRNPTAYDFRSVVRECGVRPLAPQVLVRAWRTVRRVTNAKTPEGEVIQSSFVARQPTPILSEPDDDHFVDARHAHWRALCTPLIPYTMELADATSAAFGIETRYPFFDSRLVEFCLAIPAEQKLRNGWTRWVMRNAMSGLLPEPVQWRPSKADLSPNFHRMLFERDGATIRDVVESSRLESVTEYVDPVAVRSRFRRWAAQSGALRQDGRMLFSITLLTLWVERFREAASQRSGSETDN